MYRHTSDLSLPFFLPSLLVTVEGDTNIDPRAPLTKSVNFYCIYHEAEDSYGSGSACVCLQVYYMCEGQRKRRTWGEGGGRGKRVLYFSFHVSNNCRSGVDGRRRTERRMDLADLTSVLSIRNSAPRNPTTCFGRCRGLRCSILFAKYIEQDAP